MSFYQTFNDSPLMNKLSINCSPLLLRSFMATPWSSLSQLFLTQPYLTHPSNLMTLGIFPSSLFCYSLYVKSLESFSLFRSLAPLDEILSGILQRATLTIITFTWPFHQMGSLPSLTSHYPMAYTSLFKIFFLIWTIFKVFIEFTTILFLFYILIFWPQVMWDLSFLTRDQTGTPHIGGQSLNHRTTRKVPVLLLSLIVFILFASLSCPHIWTVSYPSWQI